MGLKTILITGFEPFGGGKVNPSEEIARQLNGQIIGGHEVAGRILPCVFGAANLEMRTLLRTVDPALVIAVGQAGGRSSITPERIAINVDDARIPDNAGRRPVDVAVVARGPAAYWSTLPIKSIVEEMRSRKIPAAVSQTAGTFVCNHVFYGLMHTLRARRSIRAGFIHVPFLPAQASKGQPSLPLETMIEAIALAAEISLRTRRDLRISGGQLA
ncbi:MAG: pyrrolidone-carboxylate peptidase [Verrucomicrobia bacterium]|nr:pyrrolidone-carboxylate peptidase [Verrucomicrobiota bacterium]